MQAQQSCLLPKHINELLWLMTFASVPRRRKTCVTYSRSFRSTVVSTIRRCSSPMAISFSSQGILSHCLAPSRVNSAYNRTGSRMGYFSSHSFRLMSASYVWLSIIWISSAKRIGSSTSDPARGKTAEMCCSPADPSICWRIGTL